MRGGTVATTAAAAAVAAAAAAAVAAAAAAAVAAAAATAGGLGTATATASASVFDAHRRCLQRQAGLVRARCRPRGRPPQRGLALLLGGGASR